MAFDNHTRSLLVTNHAGLVPFDPSLFVVFDVFVDDRGSRCRKGAGGTPRYYLCMTIVPGKVVNGRIEVEDDIALPEGAEVTVYLHEEGEPALTPEQEAEIEESLAQIERGDYLSADEVLARLREQRAIK